jgi:hypothetical protein
VEKKALMQILVPGLAAAGVVLLIGLLVALSDWDSGNPGGGAKNPTAPGHSSGGKGDGVTNDKANDSGMVDAIPPVEGPDWKDIGDGMKMQDAVEGTGTACPAGASVVIHYTGWRLDGFSFDSSRKRGQPADFPLTSLIKGWQIGIPGMKPGGIRRLYIPGHLAYGAGGSQNIPPNATLVFEVKLLSFN